MFFIPPESGGEQGFSLTEEPASTSENVAINALCEVGFEKDDIDMPPVESLLGVEKEKEQMVPDKNSEPNISTNETPSIAVIENEIIPITVDVATPMIEDEGVIVPQGIMRLVDGELTSAKTALAGYLAELDMLKTSEATNVDRESFTLVVLSKRLDGLDRLDAEYDRDHRRHQAGGLASLAALTRELQSLVGLCKDELQRVDMGRVIRDLEKKRESIMTAPDRMIGTLRRAENPRIRREIGLDVARGLISEIENLVRQRRHISEEIEAVTRSIERERQRVPSLEALRSEFQQQLAVLGTDIRAEQSRLQLQLDNIEAGPSREVLPPVVVSRHTKSWRNSTRAERVEKRGKKRQAKPGSAKDIFRYFGRTPESVVSSSTPLDSLASKGIYPARSLFTIGTYVEDDRRLIFRRRRVQVQTDHDKVMVVERAILNPIERFWLCIARWQFLQKRTPGEGAPGARVGTRIRNLALDLRVPVQLATMYRNQKPEKYFYLPPASADLRTAEIEGKRTYREMWPEVAKMEGLLGRSNDDSEDDESSEEEEVNPIEVIELND